MKKIFLLQAFILLFITGWSQNVGIGIVTPQNRLHVHHATEGYIRYTNDITGSAASDGAVTGMFQGDFYIRNNEFGNIQMYTDNTRRLVIDTIGRVGIGFTSGSFIRTLSLNGSMGFYNASSYEGDIYTSSTAMYIRPKEGSSLCFPSPCPANDLILIPPTTGLFSTTGQVGIGTETPAAKLHVKGSGNALLTLDGSDPQILLQDNGVNTGFVNTTGFDLKLGTLANNDRGKIIFRTNGADRMFIDSAGYITMGAAFKAATGYKLSVNGKIMAEEVRVQLDADWPDYVFQQDYRLRSLPELERFIQANKHLPGIPSASQVAHDGIQLGDMQKRLMEKVEELTLYIIRLDKENRELKQAVSALQQAGKN